MSYSLSYCLQIGKFADLLKQKIHIFISAETIIIIAGFGRGGAESYVYNK